MIGEILDQLRLKVFFALCLLLGSRISAAETIRVAVASNFAPVMHSLADLFQKQSQHDVTLAVGSTGKHYAQILHGAPFDLFFAADIRRPQLLEQTKKIIAGSRFTYARGQLALLSSEAKKDFNGDILRSLGKAKLAIANPKLAPYGQAAKETLTKLKLWSSLQGQLIRGENIAQTFQFVQSANVAFGFVALSQIKAMPAIRRQQYWQVPAAFHKAIDQQAVQLSTSEVATLFLKFVKSVEAKKMIKSFGYQTM